MRIRDGLRGPYSWRWRDFEAVAPPQRDVENWRVNATCRAAGQEMVPDDAEGVRLAKKVCVSCPVVDECLGRAETIRAKLGDDYVIGIWGGLTSDERNRMAVLGWRRRPCPSCKLDCIPVNSVVKMCASCRPQSMTLYGDYRSLIERLVADGLHAGQIADALRLKRAAVKRVCREWGLVVARGRSKNNRSRSECGTLAAKTRHHREGITDYTCACIHVPWAKGRQEQAA